MANELQKIIQPVEIQARKYLEEISKQEVSTRADYDKMTAWLKPVVQCQKDLKNLEKEKLDPLKEQVNEIKEQFKKPYDFLDQVQSMARDKGNAFLAKEYAEQQKALAEQQKLKEAEAEKELKKLDREAKKADKFDDVTKNAVLDSIADRREDILTEATKPGEINQSNENASVRMLWTFDIENLEDVPREFLILDDKKVRESIKNGTREIKGLKIYQKPSLAIK